MHRTRFETFRNRFRLQKKLETHRSFIVICRIPKVRKYAKTEKVFLGKGAKAGSNEDESWYAVTQLAAVHAALDAFQSCIY